jgi:hypothetical protein
MAAICSSSTPLILSTLFLFRSVTTVVGSKTKTNQTGRWSSGLEKQKETVREVRGPMAIFDVVEKMSVTSPSREALFFFYAS